MQPGGGPLRRHANPRHGDFFENRNGTRATCADRPWDDSSCSCARRAAHPSTVMQHDIAAAVAHDFERCGRSAQTRRTATGSQRKVGSSRNGSYAATAFSAAGVRHRLIGCEPLVLRFGIGASSQVPKMSLRGACGTCAASRGLLTLSVRPSASSMLSKKHSTDHAATAIL